MEEPRPDLIPISALEHWSYCARQCALIHLEQSFADNVLTIRGQHAHERVHREASVQEDGVRVVRGMTLWSDALGLIGKADVVEFHGDTPYPVEHKSGRRGPWIHAELQLGAQAMCLEEILDVAVPAGAVFFRGSARRREVEIDEDLRSQVRASILAVRSLLASVEVPAPLNDARCPQCSLVDLCLPTVVGRPRRLQLLHTELFKPAAPGD